MSRRASGRRLIGGVLGAAALLAACGTGPSYRAAASESWPPVAASSSPVVVTPARAGAERVPQPVTLRIPAIGVGAGLMRLGLLSNGTLQVPPDAMTPGWFTGAPAPGELGPAIIAGHVHWNGRAGIFADLARLRLEDRIIITRRNGTSAVFRVTRVSRFSKANFPTDLVYGDIDHAGLRLITCDGFDPSGRVYRDNLVVFAVLLTIRPS